METEILANLIDDKYGVLTQLRQLARRQVDIIHQGDTSQLLNLLAVKQTVLTQLQNIEKQLDPFRSQDPDRRQWKSPPHRQRARDAATRCESLLNEIMLLERQCESELVRQRDDVAEQLQGLHVVAQAANAYAQPMPAHRQLDLSSEQ